MVARKVNTMKRDIQEDLDQRRGRLARMLAEEDAKYTAELESLEETPDSRRERLRARARELVRRREQEKREFTNQMLERQFREGCDAFREFDGQALLKECMVARDKALDERAEQRLRDKEEDALWHTRLLELVLKSDEREQNDKNRSVDLRSAMLRTLQDQVHDLKERKEEDERLKIQNDLAILTKRLSQINDSLARKGASRNEYDKTIQETEAAYMKILESSQTLLHVLKRETVNLTKKKQYSS